MFCIIDELSCRIKSLFLEQIGWVSLVWTFLPCSVTLRICCLILQESVHLSLWYEFFLPQRFISFLVHMYAYVCICMCYFNQSLINSRSAGFQKEGGLLKSFMLVRCFSQASQKELENFTAKTYRRCSSHSCIIALQLLCSSLVILGSMTGVMY